MAGAQDWQAPLTSPHQPPRNSFHFPPDPQNLTSLARQTLRPSRSRKVVEMWKLMWCWCTVAEVCLEWDKESLPCQEFCACAVRALRARSARPRLRLTYRPVGPFEPDRHVGPSCPPAGLLTLHRSSHHAILLSLRLRVTRDHTTPISSKN